MKELSKENKAASKLTCTDFQLSHAQIPPHSTELVSLCLLINIVGHTVLFAVTALNYQHYLCMRKIRWAKVAYHKRNSPNCIQMAKNHPAHEVRFPMQCAVSFPTSGSLTYSSRIIQMIHFNIDERNLDMFNGKIVNLL